MLVIVSLMQKIWISKNASLCQVFTNRVTYNYTNGNTWLSWVLSIQICITMLRILLSTLLSIFLCTFSYHFPILCIYSQDEDHMTQSINNTVVWKISVGGSVEDEILGRVLFGETQRKHFGGIKIGGIKIGNLDKIISCMCLNLQLRVNFKVHVLPK